MRPKLRGRLWIGISPMSDERIYNEIIRLGDDEYPELLKEIHDPPEELYVRGQLLKEDALALAVVGTRSYTSYGKEITREIVIPLVRAGFTIVSGMARGIDTFAHQSALDAGGRTIAVLGCGIDIPYPAENSDLYEEISRNGAVVSEFPVGMEPTHYTFPRRNRIISGLSRGILVVEAGERSGALITANLALEQNRDLFAVLGSALSQVSVGSNNLIKEGAVPVTSGEDILKFYDLELLSETGRREIQFDSEEEQMLYDLLLAGPVVIDELIEQSGLPAPTVASTLAMMEIKGIVRNIGSQEYRRL